MKFSVMHSGCTDVALYAASFFFAAIDK